MIAFFTSFTWIRLMKFSYYFVNRYKQQDLINLLEATYSAIIFLGTSNAFVVQPVVTVERTVFYRERATGMYSELPNAFAQVGDKIVQLQYIYV